MATTIVSHQPPETLADPAASRAAILEELADHAERMAEVCDGNPLLADAAQSYREGATTLRLAAVLGASA